MDAFLHRRPGMRIEAILMIGTSCAIGCIDLPGTALHRASRELACPEDQLTVVNRPDVDPIVYDVRGCGQIARYACTHHQLDDFCTREPTPDPGEEARRPPSTAVPPTQHPALENGL
jgi:hypothetical protein